MTALLVISIILIAFASLAFYRKRNSAFTDEREHDLAPARFAGLFGDHSTGAEQTVEERRRAERAEALKRAETLRERARCGDRSALVEAQEDGARELYDELLEILVAQAASSPDALEDLAAFVVGHKQLRANRALAAAVVEAWERAPDRASTARALHVAALSDDARAYERAVSIALRLRREGKLSGVTGDELAALCESEYWVLAPEARSSGAGFVLKQTLADARRELRQSVGRSSLAAEN